MLKHARSGHGPFLCHMADDKECNPCFLGKAQEYSGCLSYLRNAACRCRYGRIIHRLYGVNHAQLRLLFQKDFRDRIQIRLAQKAQIIRYMTDSRRAQLDLMQRFLAGNIQNVPAICRKVSGHL